LKKGQYFGEIALLRGGKRTTTVRASGREPVEAVRIGREMFGDIVSNSLDTREEMQKVIQKRLEELAETKAGLSS